MSDEKSATSRDFVNDLGNAVRANPLPAALIGMGLIWLFTAGRSPAKAAFGSAVDGFSGVGSRMSESAGTLGQSISDTVASAGDSIRSGSAIAVQNISGAASSLGASTHDLVRSAPAIDGQFFSAARSNLTDLMQRQPLLLGAIGLAIGAGVAASLRITATETDLLGDVSADFQGRTRDFASGQIRRATNLVDGVATAVAEEVRVQGLTPGNLKGKAGEVGLRLKSVLDQASGSVRDRLN
jgi:hypothetical protein